MRNLEQDMIFDVLSRVKHGELQITSLNKECSSIKKMLSLKKEFRKNVGVETWDEALEEFPSFAATDCMEKFLKFPPKSAEFQQYCIRTVRLVSQLTYSYQQKINK